MKERIRGVWKRIVCQSINSNILMRSREKMIMKNIKNSWKKLRRLSKNLKKLRKWIKFKEQLIYWLTLIIDPTQSNEILLQKLTLKRKKAKNQFLQIKAYQLKYWTWNNQMQVWTHRPMNKYCLVLRIQLNLWKKDYFHRVELRK